MIKFNHEIIKYEQLGDKEIKQINEYYNNRNNNLKLVIQVENTKKIDKKSLYQLNNNIKISVIGPYTESLNTSSTKEEKNFLNTLYEKDEIIKIISEFEKIEKDIQSSWNQYDILIYLIEKITRNIMYDPEFYLMHKKGETIPKNIGKQDMSDYMDRTLRGVITRKTVCAGYAVILKELANRNGIKCKYVSGKTKSGGGHAWNLVNINGVIHPIDITWKNTKYRKGEFANIENISCDIDKFKEEHIPQFSKDNDNLVKIDEEIVKKARKKTSIRVNYKSTSFILKRSDNTQFRITQIGQYKGMYRYLVSQISEDGSLKIPKIYFSESNFVRMNDAHNFERCSEEAWRDFINSFSNVLFSIENLKDSHNKKTKYIGKCEKEDGTFCKLVSEIEKKEETSKKFNLNFIKSAKREDGSFITIVQTRNTTGGRDEQYEYHIYNTSKHGRVIVYIIYSNDNYFKMRCNDVVNDIISVTNLESALSSNGSVKHVKR